MHIRTVKPFVYKIMIYPIKSLPPVEVSSVEVNAGGALLYDRMYAIVDSKGRFVNGKRERKIHLVRARYDIKGRDRLVVYVSACCSEEKVFELDDDRESMEKWLSEFLGYSVRLVKNVDEGYPDDTRYNGPTVISTATLEEIASWYPGWDISQARLRFRANIEIGGVKPFWEDNLYAGPGRAVEFRIGDVILEGRNISKRCVVPSRDPYTGSHTPLFQKIFVERRPRLKVLEKDHNYRLAVNTIIKPGQQGKKINIYDEVEILGVTSNQ
ncbi:MAG: MOSC N-terminal beta barrel domain-containing protein [Desulfurococcales archaeon]|nr:MOSC N-terminal beta barrel domain-containing protein [Desulfurococcales archaeon]